MDSYSVKKSENCKRNLFIILVDVFIWLVAASSVVFLYYNGTPYEQGFYCDDPKLSFPYKPDSVSNEKLLCGGFGISLAVILLVEVLNGIEHTYSRRPCITMKSMIQCLAGYAVFLVGFIMQLIVVLVLKTQTGSLRPNFFDVCKPEFNRTFCPGYIINFTCTGSDPDLIKDSRQSFPSGHAALAMYVAIFYCIYVQIKLNITYSYTAKPFIQFGLVLISTLIGLERIQDNKHHPIDVAVGFCVGIIIAIFVFRTIGLRIFKNTSHWTSNITNFQAVEQSRDLCACSMSNSTFLTTQDHLSYRKQSVTDVKNKESPVLDISPINQPVTSMYHNV
ncbi:hypothetical protein ACF0H5_004976 [Mactra antiquata]